MIESKLDSLIRLAARSCLWQLTVRRVSLRTWRIIHSTYASRETRSRGVTRISSELLTKLDRDLSSRLADSPGIDLWKFRPKIRWRKHDVSLRTWPSLRSVDLETSKLLVPRRLFDRDCDVKRIPDRWFRTIRGSEYKSSAMSRSICWILQCFRDRDAIPDMGNTYNFRQCTRASRWKREFFQEGFGLWIFTPVPTRRNECGVRWRFPCKRLRIFYTGGG